MPPRAVLFDAFGTLVHPEPGWESLRAECLAIVHGTWTGAAVPLARFLEAYERSRAAQHAAVGDTLREFDFSERFASAILSCGAPRAEALAWGRLAAEKYHRFQQALVHPYDQPARVLERLRAEGYRLAVVSNFGHAGVLRDAFGRLGLLPHFEAFVVSADVGYLKPHRAVFDAALDALGVGAQDAVMVGNDLECDVLGARRAGIKAVWTPYPRQRPAPRHPEADAVLERMADLPDVLAKL